LNTLQAMVIAKALGIPVLLRAESRLARKQNGALKRVAKNLFFSGLKELVDAVLPIGSANAAYWRHFLGEELPQFLMPYAVNNDYFQSRSREAGSRREDLRRELSLDTSRPVILFASKLQKRKRCEDLLEAYLDLCSEIGGGPVPYLVIVGDGAERAALERRVKECGASGVRFCGFRNQSELPRFFDLATVFVLPSQHEPWGLIVNEVMNSGRAVILSDDVGCQADLVTDGVEGCVFAVGDVKALTDALRRVLMEPGTAEAMGECGLKRISQWSYEQDMVGLRQALAAVTRRLST
jgi:glycosyltransferase involved in cell wall biosynthesis